MSDIALPKYAACRRINNVYGIGRSTLRSWADAKQIGVVRYGEHGKRLYNVKDVEQKIGVTEGSKTRICACYARVSSAKQSADLERQVADLQKEYPSHTVFKDIGSGLNWKRPQFLALLEQICSGLITEVVIAYRDRLCRFGFELLEWLCNRYDTKLVVLHKTDGPTDATHELADDLLAVVTFFTARNNGQRAARNRRRLRGATWPTDEEGKVEKRRRLSIIESEGPQDTLVPNHDTEDGTAEVVRDGAMDLQ